MHKEDSKWFEHIDSMVSHGGEFGPSENAWAATKTCRRKCASRFLPCSTARPLDPQLPAATCPSWQVRGAGEVQEFYTSVNCSAKMQESHGLIPMVCPAWFIQGQTASRCAIQIAEVFKAWWGGFMTESITTMCGSLCQNKRCFEGCFKWESPVEDGQRRLGNWLHNMDSFIMLDSALHRSLQPYAIINIVNTGQYLYQIAPLCFYSSFFERPFHRTLVNAHLPKKDLLSMAAARGVDGVLCDGAVLLLTPESLVVVDASWWRPWMSFKHQLFIDYGIDLQ